MKTKLQKHFYYLDVLRGVSAIFIVLYHYTTRYIENPLTNNINKVDWFFTFPWGCAAVTTFFVLSGYLSAKYLFVQDAENNIKVSLNFIISRFIRLYPAYIILLCVTATVLVLFWPNWEISPINFLSNLTMVPSLFGQKPIDGVYWTLQVELFFYLIIAFIMLIRNKYVVKGLLFIWLLVPYYLRIIDNETIHSIFNVVFIASFVHNFIAGISLYLICNNEKIDLFSALMLSVCVFNQFIGGDFYHNLFFVVTLIMIYLIVKNDKLWNKYYKNVRVLKWIGDISYPLYLVHQMVGFTIIFNIQKLGITSELIIIIPIILCVFIAYFVHVYWENPCQAFLKKQVEQYFK